AETVLGDGASSPGLTVRFFERFPPLTPAGSLRFAEALAASGRSADAADQARRAWRSGVMRPADESKLIGAFTGGLTADDHDTRMDMLLWQGALPSAQRQIGMTSAGKRAVFEARVAFRTNAADVSTKAAAA